MFKKKYLKYKKKYLNYKKQYGSAASKLLDDVSAAAERMKFPLHTNSAISVITGLEYLYIHDLLVGTKLRLLSDVFRSFKTDKRFVTHSGNIIFDFKLYNNKVYSDSFNFIFRHIFNFYNGLYPNFLNLVNEGIQEYVDLLPTIMREFKFNSDSLYKIKISFFTQRRDLPPHIDAGGKSIYVGIIYPDGEITPIGFPNKDLPASILSTTKAEFAKIHKDYRESHKEETELVKHNDFRNINVKNKLVIFKNNSLFHYGRKSNKLLIVIRIEELDEEEKYLEHHFLELYGNYEGFKRELAFNHNNEDNLLREFIESMDKDRPKNKSKINVFFNYKLAKILKK